jgi:hypothetical protein
VKLNAWRSSLSGLRTPSPDLLDLSFFVVFFLLVDDEDNKFLIRRTLGDIFSDALVQSCASVRVILFGELWIAESKKVINEKQRRKLVMFKSHNRAARNLFG